MTLRQHRILLPSQTISMIDLENDASLIDHALWDLYKEAEILGQNYLFIDNFDHHNHSGFQQ